MTDESRPIAVSPERLDEVTKSIFPHMNFRSLDQNRSLQVMQIAMMSEQLELLRNIDLSLREAHDVYNARFR